MTTRDLVLFNEFRCPKCCSEYFRSSGGDGERVYYCRACDWSGSAEQSFTAPRPAPKPRRSQRGLTLLMALSRGPDFSEPLTRERYHDWFQPLRAELIDLLPELRMARRVTRECLAAVREWPTDQPFLTPLEFVDFVRLLHTCECEVTTTKGKTLRGFLFLFNCGDQVSIQGTLLASADVADLVCVDRRVSFEPTTSQLDASRV